MQLHGATVFNGESLCSDTVVQINERGFIDYIGADDPLISNTAGSGSSHRVTLPGGYLCPGFVDLQVNGGGGVLLNDEPSVATLRTMADAHLSLGTSSLLPTLITDEPAKIEKSINAVASAIADGVPLIAGLHLEGPHISIAKKGAHPSQHICPMTAAVVDRLVAARQRLPVLKITLAPESVTAQQITELTSAGIIVSLGHSAAAYDDCRQAFKAGASAATHLFNAMSQMMSREPGLTGAALDDEAVACGIIVDGHHVSYPCIRLAVALKSPIKKLYLVSDAMAVAASPISSFSLQGRRVKREQGRLTLDDGTLAGADLSLAQALINVMQHCDIGLADALAMVTSVPARFAGIEAGSLLPGRPANLIWLDDNYRIQRIWYQGVEQYCTVMYT